jgi:excisionase family DNA binding protein
LPFLREDARMIPQIEEVERLAVNVPHAAQMLDVSPRTIENYIRAKILPARKIGRRTVIPVDALKAFLNCDQPLTQSPLKDAGLKSVSVHRDRVLPLFEGCQ